MRNKIIRLRDHEQLEEAKNESLNLQFGESQKSNELKSTQLNEKIATQSIILDHHKQENKRLKIQIDQLQKKLDLHKSAQQNDDHKISNLVQQISNSESANKQKA